MKQRPLHQAQFQREDNVYSIRRQQIQNRQKHAIQAILVFTLLSLLLAAYRYYLTLQIMEDGQFYVNIKQMKYYNATTNQQKSTPSQQGSLAISNQQLGTMSWAILHMSAGTFPIEFNQDLANKFNIFMNLFGQLYPCKECGKLFLQYLDEMKPFKGSRKQHVVAYICDLHNKFNQGLGKPLSDCQTVSEEWKMSAWFQQFV